MSWNRPTNNQQVAARAGGKASLHTAIVRVAIGLSVAILGALSAWYFLFDQSVDDTRGPKRHSADSSRPNMQVNGKEQRKGFVAKTANVKTAKIEKPEIVPDEAILQPQKKGRVITFRKPENQIFENEFDGYVQGILTAIPGSRFLEVPLGESFDEYFAASLKTKIDILPDDSEDVREIKQAVIEAKGEILRQMKDGRKPHEILEESRRELNKIADYRDQLQKAFDELAINAKSPQEIIDYCQEANRILEEYGSLPIEGATTEGEAVELQECLIENKRQEEELEAAKAAKSNENLKTKEQSK